MNIVSGFWNFGVFSHILYSGKMSSCWISSLITLSKIAPSCSSTLICFIMLYSNHHYLKLYHVMNSYSVYCLPFLLESNFYKGRGHVCLFTVESPVHRTVSNTKEHFNKYLLKDVPAGLEMVSQIALLHAFYRIWILKNMSQGWEIILNRDP